MFLLGTAELDILLATLLATTYMQYNGNSSPLKRVTTWVLIPIVAASELFLHTWEVPASASGSTLLPTSMCVICYPLLLAWFGHGFGVQMADIYTVILTLEIMECHPVDGQRPKTQGTRCLSIVYTSKLFWKNTHISDNNENVENLCWDWNHRSMGL